MDQNDAAADEPGANDPSAKNGLVGSSVNLTFEVTSADTAEALMSGDVPVLATPRLIAWVEAATVAAVSGRIPTGMTSVGTRVQVEHLAATPVGGTVAVRATVLTATATAVEFEVEAEHWVGQADPRVVLTGHVVRALVNHERFVARALLG